jgi:hypothetical protein
MPESFDPYLQWLGIRDPQRPPNHYRLLGVEPFEDDTDVIANAADRQMAHVRTFQMGKHSIESQRILNELAAANICLLNADRKNQYDARLRARRVDDHGLPTRLPTRSRTIVVLGIIAVVLAGLITVIATTRPRMQAPSDPVATAAAPRGEPAQPPSPAPEPPPLPTPKPVPPPPIPTPRPEPKPRPRPQLQPTRLPPAGESILAARAAIAMRDLATAKRLLDRADEAAYPKDRAEIERLRTVLVYLDVFWQAVHKGVMDLKPGRRLDVDGTAWTVVRTHGDGFVLRQGDRETPYTIQTLPTELALAISEPRLPDGLPSSILAKAAFMIFDPAGDRAAARRLCRKAARLGLPTAELIEELKRTQVER